MKNFIATIARMLAAAIRFVLKLVVVGGKAVWQLVAVKPEPMQENIIPSDSVADGTDLVKRVAAILASGREPSTYEIGGLSDKTFEWLSRLDQRALCRVATAQGWLIKEHLAGKHQILHVQPYREQVKPAELVVQRAEPRRTLREVLFEKGIYPAM